MYVSGMATRKPVVVVHGGAGAGEMIRLDASYAGGKRAGVMAAARAGWQALTETGGTAVDAVQRAVEVFEEDPYSNAGEDSCNTYCHQT